VEVKDNAQSNMPAAVRNTVDRLDKPSAYYQSRVSNPCLSLSPEVRWTDNDHLPSRTRNANTIEIVMIGREEIGHRMSR
jgi:hypothetical protein